MDLVILVKPDTTALQTVKVIPIAVPMVLVSTF
jgi:hypothetical protein